GGPDGAGHILDRGQGDHFAADLGEAFRPAENGDVALGVDVDDVAGVVPTVRQDLQIVRLAGGDIAFHHIGAAQEQAAADLDAFDRLDAVFHARHDLAHRAGPVAVRVVHGDH